LTAVKTIVNHSLSPMIAAEHCDGFLSTVMPQNEQWFKYLTCWLLSCCLLSYAQAGLRWKTTSWRVTPRVNVV